MRARGPDSGWRTASGIGSRLAFVVHAHFVGRAIDVEAVLVAIAVVVAHAAAARAEAEAMCRKLLANPVTEDFDVYQVEEA